MNKILVDVPIGEDVDAKFAFSVYKQAIVELIENSHPQYTIGIFGKWGTGKTTLMKLIERNLDKNKDCITVFFNPWRYESDENLLIPMLHTVRMSIEKNNSNSSHLEKITRSLKALVRASKIKISSGLFEYELEGQKVLKEESQNEDKKYSDDLYKISDLLQESVPNGKKLIIFIDDLDRCLPDKALHLFNSIKSFLDLPGYVFVIGLDQEVIIEAINDKYKKESSFGESYVNKIIQIPFHLPLIKTTELPSYIEAFPLQLELKDLIDEVVEGMETNPREIKRLVNSFILQREILKCDKQKVLSPYLDEKLLLKFLLLQFRWKRFYDDMVDYHPEFSNAVIEYLNEPERIESPEENNIDEFKMLKDLFKDKSLLKFITNNREIFKNPELMEDYFYFTKASIGTTLDSTDVSLIWEDILSNEKIKIDRVVSNISKINQRVLIRKIDEELRNDDISSKVLSNIVRIIKEMDEVSNSEILDLIFDKSTKESNEYENLNLLLLLDIYNEKHINYIEDNYQLFNTDKLRKKLFQLFKRINSPRVDKLIKETLLTLPSLNTDEFVDIFIMFPKHFDSTLLSKFSSQHKSSEVKAFLKLVGSAKEILESESKRELNTISKINLSRKMVKDYIDSLVLSDTELSLVVLELLLKNKDVELRRYSAIHLGNLGKESQLESLKSILPREREKRVRTSISIAIDKIKKRNLSSEDGWS